MHTHNHTPRPAQVVKVTEHRPTTAVPELQQAIARAAGMERRGGVGPWTLDDGTPERLVAEGELPPPVRGRHRGALGYNFGTLERTSFETPSHSLAH